MLPRVQRYPASFVINTAPHDHPGEHWVAAFLHSKEYGEYFDSYGLRPIEPRITTWLLKNAYDICYSGTLLQDVDPTSDACGPFAICFVAMKDLGYSLEDIITHFYKTLPSNDMVAATMARLFNRIKISTEKRTKFKRVQSKLIGSKKPKRQKTKQVKSIKKYGRKKSNKANATKPRVNDRS